MSKRCVILCKVVDNYGDAGVCWRLARQMMDELGWQVRLVCDRPEVIARVSSGQARHMTVVWEQAASHDPSALFENLAPDLVIAAFACDLPVRWRAQMARADAPSWVNLEYLSAEPWIDSHHGMLSLKPDGARELFFFPGFGANTGGLLRERGLLAQFDQWLAAAQPWAWLDEIFAESAQPFWPVIPAPVISLFCYPEAPLTPWIQALGDLSLTCLVAQGVPIDTPAGRLPEAAGSTLRFKQSHWVRLPWLTHEAFDRLLVLCDLNVVRGEDSWIRAQWAGKPFLWQPYVQTENTHWGKSQAFTARVLPFFENHAAATAWNRLMQHWSGASLEAADSLCDDLKTLLAPGNRSAFLPWRDFLAGQAPLHERLASRTRLL